MTLKDHGFRFMISPDKVRGRWCNPIEIPNFYKDCRTSTVTYHTDTPEKEFIELQSPVDTATEQP